MALGHCLRKLLPLAYAVWKSNRPFDAQHGAGETPTRAATTTAAPAAPPTGGPDHTSPDVDTGRTRGAGHHPSADCVAHGVTGPVGHETAVGHQRDVPAEEVVTTATPTVAPLPPPVKSEPSANRPARPKVDFAFLRPQVTLEQVLRHLGLLDTLRGRGLPRRGPCPLHGGPDHTPPTFAAHLGQHVFPCFHAECRAQGNVLDLWAALHQLSLYEAALPLAETFHLPRNSEEEPVGGTR